MSGLGIRGALLVVVGLLGLAAVYFLRHDRPAEDPTNLAGVAAVPAQPLEYPRVVIEDKGRLEIVRPVQQTLPPTVVEPLFEADARLTLNETTKLKFAAHDRATGHPLSGATVTASVTQGKGPALPLSVEEVEDGVFEVPFTPRGPGQFQIALNVDGVPAGSRKVGVVGAVGATDNRVDVGDPVSVDPRNPRSRTSGRSRRR